MTFLSSRAVGTTSKVDPNVGHLLIRWNVDMEKENDSLESSVDFGKNWGHYERWRYQDTFLSHSRSKGG